MLGDMLIGECASTSNIVEMKKIGEEIDRRDMVERYTVLRLV